jgi:DNA polymerase-3 subunit alpha
VQVNKRLTEGVWDKYCTGSLSKWEMDSVSFYSHDHELAALDMGMYGLADFEYLPEQPLIERVITTKDGKHIPLYELNRIAGTVLDRDKAKKTVTLLTTSGVVTVKIYGVFAQYDKQISERGADGKKHVIEKSMFSRGNKIIIVGIRDGDSFRAKKYKQTPYHLVEQIVEVYDDGTMLTRSRGEQ